MAAMKAMLHNLYFLVTLDVQTTNPICLGYYLDTINITCSVITNKNTRVPIFIENQIIAQYGYILRMYQI